MNIITDEERIEEVLTRGVEEVIHQDALRKKLLSGERLRIKLGIDPTSPHIHLGRAVTLLKLRDFQELGHQVIFIVGDFTGIIGDTSDKDSERPMLTKDEIEENKRTYLEQAAKILDIGDVECRHNSEWLSKLTYGEIGEHANAFSVSDFIARDNIKRRLDEGKRVSLREVLYPLMQGYDSVVVRADVEIGGVDQRFNLLAGRTLQERFGQKPQDILMNPLLGGTDGRKMSSSWGNTVTLTADPKDMYGKVMSIHDSEIMAYFTMCTRISRADLGGIQKKLDGGENPRDAKMQLAREIVRMYHGEESATAAEMSFVETFQQGNVPEEVIEIRPVYADQLITCGVVASKTELRRLLEAGGVRDALTGEKLSTLPDAIEEARTLKIGKRRFVKLLP